MIKKGIYIDNNTNLRIIVFVVDIRKLLLEKYQ